MWSDVRPDLLLGGVAIPERHAAGTEEHHRLIAKQAGGCSFFVTQVVYDVNATKNLVSDYHYACRQQGLAPVTIVFTLSVCGSVKTLKFLQWLGVSVPRWMQNEFRHTDDTLPESDEQCRATADDLMAFCRRLDAPFGFNVESVSIRRAEIDTIHQARRPPASPARLRADHDAATGRPPPDPLPGPGSVEWRRAWSTSSPGHHDPR